MKTKFHKIFNKNKKIVIGAIHFPPLLGYPDFPGMEIAINNALNDLQSFEQGGVDAVIFENNYDLPHKEFVEPEIVAAMTFIGSKLKAATALPLGINVLWNDYKTSLVIAKILGLEFIRVPVFVDEVKTDYGVIRGNSKEIHNYQNLVGANDVALFTDIHVKHSALLSKMTISESAKAAIANGSDALIITGKWTGDAPDYSDLKQVRNEVGDFPLIAGSGCNKENIKEIFSFTDAAIISTSLKEGDSFQAETNLKKWSQRISENKVKEFMKAIV
ncbi:MAG: BtpA/SgcQ family protein [Candidatus Falkowbacteria bacterium]|nr:BtpA/SgcQ family protein [Candidatus Falkowbacteria bacterium]